MHSRTLLTAALVPAVLAACSGQTADRTKPSTSEGTRQEQELALTSATPSEGAVVSPIEVARPGEAKQSTSPRKTLASRKHASTPAEVVATPIPTVNAGINDHAATQDATPALTEIPLIAMPTSGPSVAEPERPAVEGPGRIPEPIDRRPGVRIPGIIIRGGRGGSDPCDIHNPRGGEDPRGGVPPVLVNPRVPTIGLPTAPRGGGGIRF